jgi:hypothetical protein
MDCSLSYLPSPALRQRTDEILRNVLQNNDAEIAKLKTNSAL